MPIEAIDPGHAHDPHPVASSRVSRLEGRDVVNELAIEVIRQFRLILPGSRSGISLIGGEPMQSFF